MGQRLYQRFKQSSLQRLIELFAIKLDLEFAMDNGWDSFKVESGCMEAVNLLSEDSECLVVDRRCGAHEVKA